MRNNIPMVVSDIHCPAPLTPQQRLDLPLKIAVIDLGSNSAQLVIVQIWEDLSYTFLHEERTQVRLGSPVFEQGSIDPQSQSRALAAIRKFQVSCCNHGVNKVLTFATSALREAANSREVIEQIKKETGLEVNVISGREEARLTAMAAIESLGLSKGKVFLIDVGGGSTELAWMEDSIPKTLLSLQLGPVRILQKVSLIDPPGNKGLEDLRKVIRKGLAPILREKIDRPDWTVGTSGTALCLGELCGTSQRAVTSLEVRIVHKASLRNLLERLAEMDLEKRREWMGVYAERADSILPGGMIFLTAMEELGLDTLVTGAKALKVGIVLDFLERELQSTASDRSNNLIQLANGERPIEEAHDVRSMNVLKLARRYGYESRHCNTVLHLARQLFDELRSQHWLGEDDRFYLESAALLHDIGYHIGTTRHHHHSHYLVVNSDMEGFHQMEIRLIANLVKYHSHELPGPEDADYWSLPEELRHKIDILAGILRIADALDFSHQGLVKTVKVSQEGRKLNLHVTATGPLDLEIQETLAKGNLLEKALSQELEVVEEMTGQDVS